MVQTSSGGQDVAAADFGDAFRMEDRRHEDLDDYLHIFGRYHAVCSTDGRGHALPRGASKEEIVLDNTEGYIPLWDKDVTLRWRFNAASMQRFAMPDRAATALRRLISEAVSAWGDAVPVRFVERQDDYDFEIAVREADRCSLSGCVLASAFFPDAGQHELKIYPKMFSLSRDEQVETLVHEFGHVFGLRHFFALISEKDSPAVVFGEHNPNKPFSIMNYGPECQLTEADVRDLKEVYQLAWSRKLTHINHTRIELMRPHHEGSRGAVQAAALVNVFEPRQR